MDVLFMKRAPARIVPNLLNFEHNNSTSHLHRLGDVDDDPDLLKKVIIDDKSWI